jgi:hypothetical protein
MTRRKILSVLLIAWALSLGPFYAARANVVDLKSVCDGPIAECVDFCRNSGQYAKDIPACSDYDPCDSDLSTACVYCAGNPDDCGLPGHEDGDPCTVDPNTCKIPPAEEG